MSVRIITGDVREVLPTLASESVQCCVTSPPYWGLRNYQVDGQIGLEPHYADHIAALVEVFREVRRTLRKDGTLWLNYGDCYATSVNGRSAADTKAAGNDDRTFRDKPFGTVCGSLKPKDLVGMPWRLAFALQEDGWWLRSAIVWHKPNPMPESITDRPTSSYEHVFLLAKSERYFFDAEAVRESADPASESRYNYAFSGTKRIDPNNHQRIVPEGMREFSTTRNLRNVWTIATSPFPEAHFATFPPELAERCIKAGTSERGCCAACGKPWGLSVTKGEPDLEHRAACGADAAGGYDGQSTKGHDTAGVQNASDVKRRILDGLRHRTSEFRPSCSCDAPTAPCTVLDPFSGAGTTALVADRLGRNAIGIELNPNYVAMSRRRIERDAGLFAEVT